jgi:hypothetical protein
MDRGARIVVPYLANLLSFAMSIQPDKTATGKAPGIEGFKATNALTSQVITVAAGLLAFTVTFAEKFTPTGKPVVLPFALKISWLCFALTIVFGFWTLMAVVGTLDQIDRGQPETNPQRTNIAVPARTMFALFLVAVLCLMMAGWNIAGK